MRIAVSRLPNGFQRAVKRQVRHSRKCVHRGKALFLEISNKTRKHFLVVVCSECRAFAFIDKRKEK